MPKQLPASNPSEHGKTSGTFGCEPRLIDAISWPVGDGIIGANRCHLGPSVGKPWLVAAGYCTSSSGAEVTNFRQGILKFKARALLGSRGTRPQFGLDIVDECA